MMDGDYTELKVVCVAQRWSKDLAEKITSHGPDVLAFSRLDGRKTLSIQLRTT